MISIFKRNKKSKDISAYKRMIAFDAYFKSDNSKEFIKFLSDLIIRLPEFDYNITTVCNEVDEDYDNFCKNMNLENVDSGLIISDSNSLETVFYVKHNTNITSITFWFEYKLGRLEKIIEAVKNNQFLYYGTLYSQYDNKWENEEKIIVYNINKKSKKGKKYTKDMFDKKCIDVNFNYGRTLRLNNIGFVAGWKMWFGIDFPSIIKEELASLNLEHKNTTTNITEVRLFEKLISDNYEINRPIQQQFLEIIKTTYNNIYSK